MQFDELIAAIGSERDSSSPSTLNGFSWLSSSDKVPKHGDSKLAESIRSGKSTPSTGVVAGVIRLNLIESAAASITSFHISEGDSIRLMSHFEGLLDVFLSRGHYNPEKLRECLRNEIGDDELFRILEKCTLFMEESMASMDDPVAIERYIEFVSVVIDARFMSWFVKGDGVEVGSRLTRLTAIVSRYRRLLFSQQQKQIKSCSDSHVNEPKFDGSVFYHQLV